MKKVDELGFKIIIKYVLIPSKCIVFFSGRIIDAEWFKIFFWQKRNWTKVSASGSFFVHRSGVQCTQKCFASFIGVVVRAFNVVSVWPFHYRKMEWNKVDAVNSCYGDFDSEVIITQESNIKFDDLFKDNLKSENEKLIGFNFITMI